MKKKIVSVKKLNLIKESIAELENKKQDDVLGGGTLSGQTCCTVDGTIVYTITNCTSACPPIKTKTKVAE